jgi:hypothetical protein
MSTTSNQRKFPRYAALFDAKYTIASGTFKDSVNNVSAGGIYIRTPKPIEQGQRIRLRFPIFAFDRRPSVEGLVVRSEQEGFAVKFDLPIEERIPL